jgi:FMN phosphatase YigB (HAD superfamily)
MAIKPDIDFVFFDIGGTLAEFDQPANKLVPFPSSVGLLKVIKNLGLRVGIITTLGTQLTKQQGLDLLRKAGLDSFLDPLGLISDKDLNIAKPRIEIYRFAAQHVGLPVDRCLFVGENLIEVIGAIAAGMKAVLKPSPPGRDLPS